MPDFIEDIDVFREKIAEESLTIIDFTATWCGPCQMVGPKFDELSKKHTNYNFFKVDVDEGEEIAQECDIQCMPTFKFYKKGQLLDTISGNKIEDVEKKIQELA